jgi:hypothetical protein
MLMAGMVYDVVGRAVSEDEDESCLGIQWAIGGGDSAGVVGNEGRGEERGEVVRGWAKLRRALLLVVSGTGLEGRQDRLCDEDMGGL